ncbi:hypothetical protein HYC85_005167 [Camellia sinensis]|uniref:ALA-interacting subunit n=1 Tax=Camellia sinensis TaxID=4442 RepID=A0A7J7HYR3_CAMSI|nr:hypothetical protein HYC85_005167 [Camellia sinensis]
MNPGGSDGVSETSAAAAAAAVKRKKPKYSRFTQQELPACKPILTPGWVITAFVLVAIIFIPIGLASLFASEHVPKQMKSPIYIYYQLDNFYQNHRRYVKSRSDNQLRSRAYEFDTEDCEPEAKTDKGPIVPCGLIAWSLFNDTYGFMLQNKSLQYIKPVIPPLKTVNCHVEDDDVIKPHDLKSYENPLFGLGETAKYKLDIDIGYGRGLDSVDKAEEVAAIVQVCTGKDSDQECESMV